jgi:hypothetical protein
MTRIWVATKPLTIPADIEIIEKAAASLDARLIVVDPLMTFLDRDAYRDQAVRQALTPLKECAERLNAAILLIRHLTKAASRSSLYRGGGSVGLVAATRSALLVDKDPNDSGMRVLCHYKSNLGPLAPSLRFEPVGDDGTIVLHWHGECDCTPEDLLKPPSGHGEKLNEAKKFLAEFLQDGPAVQKKIAAKAEGKFISYTTLERAKAGLGVKSHRRGFGPGSEIIWRLP